MAPVRDRVLVPVFVNVAEAPEMIPDRVPEVVVTSMMAPVVSKLTGLAAVTAEIKARVVPAVMVRVLVPRASALPNPIVPAAAREVPPV